MEIQPFTFSTLPEVPLLEIFSRLDPLTLYRVGLVCRRFRELSSTSTLWEQIFVNAPVGLPINRDMVGCYLTGRLFSIPPKVTYLPHGDLPFPPTERDDYIAWRHSSHPFKTVRIDGDEVNITHFSQHGGRQAWVTENAPAHCLLRDTDQRWTIHRVATGFIVGLKIIQETLIVESIDPSTVSLINCRDQTHQTIPGDLAHSNSHFLLIHQPLEKRLIVIDIQNLDFKYYPFSTLRGTILLLPNGQEILYHSSNKLYLKNLEKNKRKCVFSWHYSICAIRQALSSDGIHCALVLRRERTYEENYRPTNHLVIINLNTCRVVYSAQITKPDLRLGEIYFSKDLRSIILCGSREQTTFEFGTWACSTEDDQATEPDEEI